MDFLKFLELTTVSSYSPGIPIFPCLAKASCTVFKQITKNSLTLISSCKSVYRNTRIWKTKEYGRIYINILLEWTAVNIKVVYAFRWRRIKQDWAVYQNPFQSKYLLVFCYIKASLLEWGIYKCQILPKFFRSTYMHRMPLFLDYQCLFLYC